MCPADRRKPADSRYEEQAAKMMAEGWSPEEYAARCAHQILCFSMDDCRYQDPVVDAWISRLGDILFRRNGVPSIDELRQQYLTPEEIREAEAIEQDP